MVTMAYVSGQRVSKKICSNSCKHRCKEGFTCEARYGVCRALACSPECASTQACVEVAGKMTCVPQCNPKCDAGLACNYTASTPVCVLPNPRDFTLFISMQVRGLAVVGVGRRAFMQCHACDLRFPCCALRAARCAVRKLLGRVPWP